MTRTETLILKQTRAVDAELACRESEVRHRRSQLERFEAEGSDAQLIECARLELAAAVKRLNAYHYAEF